MPKYARGSDIDLDEVYGALLNDKHAAMRRNIRTKTYMNSVHHCEDPECGGGAPKAKCITRLHFAFCIAPVVDEDPESPTCKEVVIHGERFAIISAGGCAEHPNIADYNLDLKDARKDRAKYNIRWKTIFESFKLQHEKEMAEKAEKLKAMKKMLGMTGHQRQTMRARLDNTEYQKRRQMEDTGRMMEQLDSNHDDDVATRQSGDQEPTVLGAPVSYKEVPGVRADENWSGRGEIVPAIAVAVGEALESILAPMWLHDALFLNIGDFKAGKGEPEDWKMILDPPEEVDLPVPTSEWLHDGLFPEPDSLISVAGLSDDSLPPTALIATEGTGSIHDAQMPVRSHIRRKDAKQAKKQRAAISRALKRTRLEGKPTQDAEEMTLAQATKGREGRAPFA